MKNKRVKYQGSGIKGQKLLIIILLSVYCLLLFGISNAEASEITDIEIMDNAVKIKTTGAMKYKLHKPDDPFRIVVDIEGAGSGKFKDTIYSSKAGITEIKLSQIKNPVILSRLDILLQSPSDVRPELKDNTLMLYIETSEKIDADLEKGDVAKEITDVTFDKSEEGVEIIIKGDGQMPEPVVYEKDKVITIDIPMIAMKSGLPKNISYPVKDIRYRTESGKVRFNIELVDAVEKEVFALDDEIIVDIAFKDRGQKTEDRGQPPPSPPLTKGGIEGGVSSLISLDFQDADIVPILRLLGDVGKYNIVVHPEVKGTITMKLLNVPWEQALDIVLKTFNLEKIVEGNVIRVVTRNVYAEELKAVMAVEAAKEISNIETKILTVNYADVEQVKDTLEKANIIRKENISIDKRTRSLIVKDMPTNIDEARKLIATLDKPTPQILIEARIVEMNSSFIKDIGVQWGLMWLSSNWSDSLLGSAGPPVTGGQFPMAVNLPAFEPTSAVTFGYLNAAQTFGLDLRLSAAESIGKAKIISSPKIMTIENEKAEITHGTQIPVITPGTRDNPPTVTYKDANLKLVVTPTTTPDGQVFLNLEITNDEADFDPRRAILGNVPINKREAKSKVLVKNGETVVIGGILRSREDEGERRVPGISKVPVLGWLFKNEKKNIENQELLVFITPRIVN